MPAARKRPTRKAFGCDRASAIPETDGRVGGQGLLSAGEEQEDQRGTEGRKGNTIFVKMRQNAHFETTTTCKTSKIVVEAKEKYVL